MVIRHIMILVSCFFLCSCAIGTLGVKNIDALPGYQIDELKGKTKQEIIGIIGIPEKKVVIDDTEYWSYKWQNGGFIFFAGAIYEREYILHFNNDIVSDLEIIETGDIIGILMVPGAITR